MKEEKKKQEKPKENKNRKFSKENVKEWMQNSSDKKSRVLSIIGVLVVLLVFVGGLIIKRNSQTASISPELARAMEYTQFEDGDEAVEGTDNVKFSAFFLRDVDEDGYAEKLDGTCKEIGKEDTLYMEINVQTAGYLKDAKIQIDGKNFYLQTALPKDDELKDNYVGNNIKEIEFEQLANGTQKLLTGIVRSGDYSYTSTIANAIGKDSSKYSVEDNQIILTGTYVDEEGNETEISKTIDLTMDWYGTVKTSLYSTNQTYRTLDSIIDEESQTIKLNFTVTAKETLEELNISKSYVEGTIPELNGYTPIEVSLVGDNANFTYDEETKIFTVEKEATTDDTGLITNAIARSNTYSIQAIYPLEAYQTLGTETVEISVPVEAYYEGYNNPNEEFENPYRSNTATATIVATFEKNQGNVTAFDIKVGKYVTDPESRYMVSKQKPLKIYNGTSGSESNDTYLVTWYGYVGTNDSTDGMIMKETITGETQENDQFIKTDSTTDSMENVTTNVGIYFGSTTNLLGEDGWIKVYNDETDELLMTFDKTNFSKYTSSNPYSYTTPVKHIRIETSQTKNEASLYVYNIKELDDEYITTNYTKEEFDNLQYIKSTLVGYLGDTYIEKDVAQAIYEEPYSIANISISKDTISTQMTEENEKITIQTKANESSNQVKWENGNFLVKLPSEILTAEINEVTINKTSVQISSYELIERDGNKFIKIDTTNTTPQIYTITIDVNLTPDPRIETTTGTIELYASNEAESDYYYSSEDIYDVNNNLNTQERINKTSTSINLVSPNSLLTNQTASNYDDTENIIVAPQIADIKQTYAEVDGEEKSVDIGLQIKNNYSSTISDVLILGKIPFEGNTYVISGKDLGSNFTTKMTNAGIELPEELQGEATVYYSENENPGKEIDNTENGWKTAEEITNWDNIKTFLIDFNDYLIEQGKEYVFKYTVKIPNGLEFNQVAYSHHGVYFSLDTEEGKYRTQTEPNKLGLRIAEKYNLELLKYQIEKEKLVSGATYKILEEGQEEGKTAVTDSEGKLTINNLYAEKTYTIQEIKSPNDYELNEELIKFIAHVDDNGNLSIEKLEGTTREDIVVEKNEGEDYKAIIKVEDEVKARLKIIKKEQGTENLLKGVRYKITGAGLAESGRTLTTNVNGEVSLSGLKINEEYTLQEIKAEGYYLGSQIKFKITNNEGTYEIEILEGEVKESTITEEDSLPIGNLTLEDEKIPTYSLEITKIKKTIDVNTTEDEQIAQEEQAITEEGQIEALAGAKFELYKDNKLIGEYTTGEDGKLTIDNLYQYVDGKDENATYTLKEVLAPVGYSKVKDITFKVQEVEGELQFQAEDDTERSYTVEGSTLKLQIADSPSFKLIKKDKETQELLANVKFAIYNVEDGEQPAKNSKGEILGTKETINAEEYYTLTTNENGEITADLQEGLYKAVEVQAPDQYDISNQTYYFGIGESREVEKTIIPTQVTNIGGVGSDSVASVVAIPDGGYIAGGYFSNSIQVGSKTLTSEGSTDGMVIKYSSDGEVEWARNIGGSSEDHIESVVATLDGGYIAGGYFKSSSLQVGNETLVNSGEDDGMIIKYNSDGEVEWAKSVEGDANEYITSVVETSDGKYIAGGYFESSSIQVGSETLTNAGNTDGMIIKYSRDGDVELAKSIGGSDDDYIETVTATLDGGYVVGGEFYSSSIQVGNETLTNTGDLDGMVIKYSSQGEVEWARNIGGSSEDGIYSVSETADGEIIAGGYFTGSIQVGSETLTSAGNTDGMIIKYSSEGTVEWARSIEGTNINSVSETADGGIIAGGDFESSIQVGSETLANAGSADGIIIKYSREGTVEWARSIGGTSIDRIHSVAEISDGSYIAVGTFRSSSIQVENETLTNINRYATDGMLIKYQAYSEEPEVPEAQEVVAENVRKEFKMTTDVNEIDGTKGGSISGEDNNPYERVKYGESSTKEIKMIPDENYEIIAITVNGQEYQFEELEDGSYIMPQFENVTEDKHIEVTYSLTENKIIINKIDSETKAPLVGAKFRLDQIDETLDDSELYHVEVETNSEGQAITQIPFGKYSITEIQAPDGYELNETTVEIDFTADGEHEITITNQKAGKIIVHHYIKGTETQVAEDETLTGKIGETYTTAPQLDLQKYELEKDSEDQYIIPENATGKYESGDNEVIYYYVEKSIPLTVHHYIEGTENNVPLLDGTEAQDVESQGKEGEEYTTSAILDSELSDKYELVEVPGNATGTYNGDEVIVTYYYKKVERNVILTKYQEDGTTPLEGAKFTIETKGEANNESTIYTTDSQGKISTTLEAGEYIVTEIEAPEGYTLPENPTTEITITKYAEEAQIDLTNSKKQGSVIVHYYIEGTTEKVPLQDGTEAEDVTKTGTIGDIYVTKELDDVSNKYVLIQIPENASGNITEEITEVIYYYRLAPVIEVSEITKTSTTQKVEQEEQKIPYTITYTVNVENYIGEAVVTIIDQLPYAIDTEEGKVNLDGGTYNETNKTITWTETISGIDTFTNGKKEISITKNIEITYKDLDVTQDQITNIATGTIELKTPEEAETVITKEEIQAEFLTDIKVMKVWKDNETQAQKRPESIILVVKNGDTEVARQEISAKNQEGEDTSTWSYEFTGLEKYDEDGNEIAYTVDEIEKQADDLYFYTKSIGQVTTTENGKEVTITNTYTIPDDTIEITVNKVWNDNETQAQRRPETIVLQVKEGETIIQSYELDTKAESSHTFTGLQKYDENGQEITYTVDETTLEGEDHQDDLKFYTKEVTEVTDNQATIRNTFVKPEDTIQVTVNKVWEDNSNANGKRPETIVLQIKEGENVVQSYELNTETESAHTFTGLPKYNENGQEIEYTADETTLEGEDHQNDLKFYTKNISGTTITNTFTVPDDTIEITVNKTWKDNEIQAQRRPESIILLVKNDKTEVTRKEIDVATEDTYTFTDLPKYDANGTEIVYTVDEAEKVEGDLYFYTKTVGSVTATGTNTKIANITNTFNLPDDKTEVKVTKIWADNNNEAQKRPSSIVLQIKNGNTKIAEHIVTEEENIVTGNSNSWEYTFTGLAKYNTNGQEIEYTADETEVNSGDLQFYTKTISGTTVTNTFTQSTDKINVTATKVWVDNDEQKDKRPNSIIIQLKNDSVVVDSKEIEINTVQDEFTVTFENLPKYDENNNIISYTVDETVVSGEEHEDDLKFYTKTISGTTITNTFTKPSDKISVKVNKVWVDKDDIYEKRPLSLTLQVKNKETEEVIANKTITVETEDSVTFTNLEKYDENGNEIIYTADEEEVNEDDLFNYEKEIGNLESIVGETNKKQITITNTMAKIPGNVIVKYVDRATNEEISDSTNKEGIVGESFDISDDKKDIAGYTLVEEPDEKTGTYTAEEQTRTYYYAKDTKVIVKYLEKETNQVLTPDTQYEINGYEGLDYITELKTIEGYTYIESTGNTEGTMERDVVEVIYYYSQNSKVIVKYLEKDTNVVLSEEPQYEIEGYAGKEYETEEKAFEGYTFVESTDNVSGTMAKDTIEVTYYYSQNTKVIVKYLEKDTNVVLSEEPQYEIEGYAGKEYETEEKTFEGYTFVESTGNTTGTMTKDTIEVIYYYAQNTKATVLHIDRETEEILKQDTKEGKVGDIFETHSEDFDGYVLVEAPEEPDVTMTKEEQIVKYYYAHISSGVIEKHIDDITGDFLYSEVHEGNEGDEYNIQSKTFDGYDLVESKLPENAQGKMEKDVIEVKYYYIKKASVRVEYIDKLTGEKLEEDVVIDGHENDEYQTEAKDFKKYNLEEIPENATGKMVVTKNEDGSYNTETIVQYYYIKQSAGVLEKHIDISNDKVLAQEKHTGNIGDEYDILSKEFENYELVEKDENGNSKLPTNSKGTMEEDLIEVNYYYIKKLKVTVEYIDKQSGEKLDTYEIIGYEGDKYEAEDKQFDGYDLEEVPNKKTGEMKDSTIVVKYYYNKKAEVEVQYLEKDTENPLADNIIITGYVGDKYEAKREEIPYYKFVESTTNTEGTMTGEKIIVIYYYEKQTFNLKVDKWISSVTMNGISQGGKTINTKDELYKIDINRNKATTANVKIAYKIRISNIGEIEGYVDKLTEIIPTGYSFYQEDNTIHWENNNGILMTTDLKEEVIKAGEYKEITITLRWKNGESNFGEKNNVVMLTQISNPAGYQDIDKEDNTARANMLIAVATGLDRNERIAIIGIVQIVLAISMGLLVSYKKKEK